VGVSVPAVEGSVVVRGLGVVVAVGHAVAVGRGEKEAVPLPLCVRLNAPLPLGEAE